MPQRICNQDDTAYCTDIGRLAAKQRDCEGFDIGAVDLSRHLEKMHPFFLEPCWILLYGMLSVPALGLKPVNFCSESDYSPAGVLLVVLICWTSTSTFSLASSSVRPKPLAIGWS